MSVTAVQSDASIERHTDHYFNRTKQVVRRFGDKQVTYAVFMRRPVLFTPRLMVDALESVAQRRGVQFKIEQRYK